MTSNEEDNTTPDANTITEDQRLQFVLITLDLDKIIQIFVNNNISFIDFLLLNKEDLLDLHLKMYQRNRILTFSQTYIKYAKDYKFNEINDFFKLNKQFLFNRIIYDRIVNKTDSTINVPYQDTGSFYDNSIGKTNGERGNGENDQEICNYTENKNKHAHSEGNDMNESDNEDQPQVLHNKRSKPIKTSKLNLSTSKEQINDDIDQNSSDNEEDNQYIEDYLDADINNKKMNYSSKTAYNKYIILQQDADNIWQELSRLKTEGEERQNKYKEWFRKIKCNSNKACALENLSEEKESQNKEYYKMWTRWKSFEEMKMDYKSYESLKQINQYKDSKKDSMRIEDINTINEALDNLSKIINKKESLKRNINDCDNNIKENRQKLSDWTGEDYIEEGNNNTFNDADDEDNNKVEVVEEVDENEQESVCQEMWIDKLRK